MTINGRSDLAGPLCNITFGRDGTVYLVAAGVANHAGKGSAPGFPRDAGNHYLIGIEMESSGVAPWDWTADQIRIAPYLGAALERAYLQGIPADMRLQLGHKEYSSEGKIDPAGWPGDMDGLRASINAVLAGSAAIAPESSTTKPEGFLMALTDAQQADLYARIKYLDAPVSAVPGKVWAETVLRGGQRVSVKQELADAKTASQLGLNGAPAAAGPALDVAALAGDIAAHLAPLLTTTQARQFVVALGNALPKE